MTSRLHTSLLLTALFAAPLAAAEFADEEAIRQTIEKLSPGSAIERVSASAMDGLAEVVVDRQVIYVSNDGRHVLSGTLIDGSTGANLSETTRSSLRLESLGQMPDGARIRFEKDPKAERVTVFTAIDCGYCRQFHNDIARYLEQGVNIDYVVIPLGGPGSPADQTTARVYCSADPALAFTKATLGQPVQAEECESDYQKGIEMAKVLGISSTPTILAANGSIIGGFLSPEELRARVIESSKP